jgi:rod shape-determining protein MreD
MRWLPFFILAYIMLGLQVGLSGYGHVLSGRPSFVLLALVFVAMNAQRTAALVACFILGLLQDLLTQQSPLGLNAICCTLVGWFIVSTQEIVDRHHFLTHIVLALLGGLLYAVLMYTHGWLYFGWLKSSLKLPRPAGVPLVVGAMYTALLAPFVLFLLLRFKRMFGFRSLRSLSTGRM